MKSRVSSSDHDPMRADVDFYVPQRTDVSARVIVVMLTCLHACMHACMHASMYIETYVRLSS